MQIEAGKIDFIRLRINPPINPCKMTRRVAIFDLEKNEAIEGLVFDLNIVN